MSTSPAVSLQSVIRTVRGHRVILDSDIAAFYGVQVKVLNQAVKRNIERFPSDFAFQLTANEALTIRSQIVTASRRNVGAPPWAFTEHGVAMLAGVLRSERSIAISIAIIQAFVALRRTLAANQELAVQIATLGGRVDQHDKALLAVFTEIERISELPPEEPSPRVGFALDHAKA